MLEVFVSASMFIVNTGNAYCSSCDEAGASSSSLLEQDDEVEQEEEVVETL